MFQERLKKGSPIHGHEIIYPLLQGYDSVHMEVDLELGGNDQTFNMMMGRALLKSYKNKEKWVLTTPIINGTDGRKMSKSYNNTIPLFLPPKKLRKLIMKIVTNSQTIEEVKDPDKCNVFALYKLFATDEQQEALRKMYLAGGMGWGHAKNELFEVMNELIFPMREKYNKLMENKDYIAKVLDEGSEKAREIASKKIEYVKNILGF